MAERKKRIEAIGISNGSLCNGQALEEGELDIFCYNWNWSIYFFSFGSVMSLFHSLLFLM